MVHVKFHFHVSIFLSWFILDCDQALAWLNHVTEWQSNPVVDAHTAPADRMISVHLHAALLIDDFHHHDMSADDCGPHKH